MSSGVPVPSFQMSVSGALVCFPGANNSKGIFLEPASVAPSLQVFALKGHVHHASVSALAEIASGWFETGSKDTYLLSRCDTCGLTDGLLIGASSDVPAAMLSFALPCDWAAWPAWFDAWPCHFLGCFQLFFA